MAQSELIDQIDEGLARFYAHYGVEYNSLFREFCDDNGIEDISEELTVADPIDCMLIDFDPTVHLHPLSLSLSFPLN